MNKIEVPHALPKVLTNRKLMFLSSLFPAIPCEKPSLYLYLIPYQYGSHVPRRHTDTMISWYHRDSPGVKHWTSRLKNHDLSIAQWSLPVYNIKRHLKWSCTENLVSSRLISHNSIFMFYLWIFIPEPKSNRRSRWGFFYYMYIVHCAPHCL